MSYVLRLATEATRNLVVESLLAEADKRTRVASRASLEVAADKLAKRDVRSSAVRVTMLLAEAAELGQLAAELKAAEPLAVIEVARDGALTFPVDLTKLDDPTPLDVAAMAVGTPDDEDPEDDGLSAAAHAAAELAGLEAAYVDPDGPDVDTGATLEDDPAADTFTPADLGALEKGLTT